MKTFKYFDEVTSQDALNPLFPYGGSSYGPGMGQYEPIADLNADAKKKVKKSDLDQIERYADRIFAAVGIDVEFTRHFLDRVNDARNVKQITPSELTRLFKQSYKKYGKKRLNFKKIDKDFYRILLNFNRQALHAQSLGFIHPKKNEIVNFESKLPHDFKKILDFLENFNS